MALRYLILSLICAVGATRPVHAEILTLQPDGSVGKDTWIDPSNVFTSYGNSTEMRTNEIRFYDQRILIEFVELSLVPSNAIINSAKLELYLYDNFRDFYSITLTAQEITSSWDESVTYSSQPALGDDVDSVIATTNGWYSWDLTSLVQEWADGSKANNGVALYGEGDDRFQRFYSSDYNSDATLRPKLIIDYVSAVPEPTAVSLWGVGVAAMCGIRLRRKACPALARAKSAA